MRKKPVYVASREQRQSKVTANKTPHATQDAALSDPPVADLMDRIATQKVSKVQVLHQTHMLDC